MEPDRRRAERREKRGRPSAVYDPQTIGLRIDGALYDRIYQHASHHHGKNIAAAIRQLLESALNNNDCQKPQPLD